MSKAKLIDGLVLRSSTQNYYLTWRAMSSQNGILNKFDSKKLWTVPSKEQYLPAYFKKLCDEYLSSSLARRVFPVEVSKTFMPFYCSKTNDSFY